MLLEELGSNNVAFSLYVQPEIAKKKFNSLPKCIKIESTQ